ncbi:MAG TPA: DUF3352 domain-containing protein [Acidothermaceae bacterium]|jgi:hypothetical protein
MTENHGSDNPDQRHDSGYYGGPIEQPAQYDGEAAGSAAQPYGTPPASGTPAYGQPTPSQPGYPHPYGGQQQSQQQYGMGDVIIAGPAQRTRRLAPIITSVVAVLAIILAGGGFAAYKLLASSGGQPDKWAPANSIAYVKIDLNPSASAKVAAWEFERKFPEAPKVASADQLKDGLLSAVFAQDAKVNYDRDVKPWLGDRVAIAVYPDDAGKANVVGIVAVKDAGKARAGIEKIKADSASNADVGYSIQGGYAIVGKDQTSVDAAVAAARASNITANHNFTADLGHLKGDRVVTAWWDLGATVKVLSTSLPPEARGLLGSGALTGLPDLNDLGRVVMGVRVQPSYVEAEGRLLGSKTDKASKALADGDARGTLADLPGGSVMGVALANPGQLIKSELATLSGGLLGASLQGELDQAGAQLGIKLPDDVENLLGSGVAAGIDRIPADDPNLDNAFFTLLTHPDNPASALHTAKVLAALIESDGGVTLETKTQGSSVVITNDDQPGAGQLGDDAPFKNALSGVPDKSVVAGYVNLGALAGASPDAPPAAKHLDALGFYVGADATSPVFGAKLTVK